MAPKSYFGVFGIIFVIMLGFTITTYAENIPLESAQQSLATTEVEDSNSIIPANATSPIDFHVSVELLRIGEINGATGETELDFWFNLSSEDINYHEISPPDVDFMNGNVAESPPSLENHRYEKRIMSKFFNQFDFRDYPFEKLDIEVHIEPKNPWTIEKAVLHKDTSSMVNSNVILSGYKITNASADIVSQYYEYGDETYSRYVGTFTLEKSISSTVLKILFPVTLITVLSLTVLFIPKNYTPRIYLTAPLLLALVYLHMTNLNRLPNLDYLTIYDNIMIVYYTIFAINIVSLGIQMRGEEKSHEKAIKENRQIRLLLPIIVGITILLLYYIRTVGY